MSVNTRYFFLLHFTLLSVRQLLPSRFVLGLQYNADKQLTDQVLSCAALGSYSRQGPPHLLYGDHSPMKLSSVEVADTLCRLIGRRHGDKAVAASTRTAGVGHHFGPDDLCGKGDSYFLK